MHVHQTRRAFLKLELRYNQVAHRTTNRTRYKQQLLFDDSNPLQVSGPFRNRLTNQTHKLWFHQPATRLWPSQSVQIKILNHRCQTLLHLHSMYLDSKTGLHHPSEGHHRGESLEDRVLLRRHCPLILLAQCDFSECASLTRIHVCPGEAEPHPLLRWLMVCN